MTARTAAVILCVLLLADCGAAPVETSRGGDATETLLAVARAYQTAPALTDQMRFEITAGRSTMKGDISVQLGPGTDAVVETQRFVFTSVGDDVYLQRPSVAGKYYTRPLEGDLTRSLKGVDRLPVPQVSLRSGKSKDDYLAAFGLSFATGVVLLDEGQVVIDGKPYIELRFEDRENSSIKARVDPKTMLLASVELTSRFMTLKVAMQPKVMKSLPEPIAFDVAGLKGVSGVRELALSTGDMAPDFELETLDGEVVRLSNHRGSLVVLDFWATWCGPCKMSMPLLDQFTRWADDEGLAVKVIAVDMGERVKSRQQKKDVVSRYWSRHSYVMTNVMDYDNSVAGTFEVNGIPHTVVVGPDGRILKIETGFNRNLIAHLKKLTSEALDG